MFGYVKPYIPDLKVREHELYRALYCGLCRSMGRETGNASRFTLSYDFAFLAAVRFLASGNIPRADKKNCMAHPLKKRTFIVDSEELRYCAAVSAFLTDGKLRDDVNDESGFKKVRAFIALPEMSYMVRRAVKSYGPDASAVKGLVSDGLSELSRLEFEKSDSLDVCAEAFGEICAGFFSAALPEREARICREIGRGIGRFIYVADALDDLTGDFKKGHFNPILNLYGDSAIESEGKHIFLSSSVAESIKTAALLDLRRPAASAELLMDGGHPELCALVRNVFYCGMPKVIDDIIKKHTKAKDTDTTQ